MDLVRGAPGLRYVFSPSQHAKERREMLLIMTEGGVLVCPSRGQFETVPNATFLIFAKGRLYGTHWCEKCRERDTSRKGHCYGTGPRLWLQKLDLLLKNEIQVQIEFNFRYKSKCIGPTIN